jgi:hypothetical protein
MKFLARLSPLVLLLAAAAIVQWRYVATAVVPAQDAVDYVSLAQRIDREGLAATIDAEASPPWFPTCVAAVHRGLTTLGMLAEGEWAAAAQIAAAVALVLLVVPVYLTARRLGGQAAATIAGLFVIFLPATARLGADGLGDSWHLLLVGWALLALTRGAEAAAQLEAEAPRERPRSYRRRIPLVPPIPYADYETWLWWWLAGTSIGAALLVRPEAVVVALGVGAVFAGDRVRKLLRAAKPWSRGAADTRGLMRTSHFLSFASGCVACLVPYALAGITSPTALYERLRGGAAPTEERPFNDLVAYQSQVAVRGSRFTVQGSEVGVRGADLAGADGEPLVFGHKDRSFSTRFAGPAAAAGEFVEEFLQATAYVLPLLAFVGFRMRWRVAPHPADRYRLAAVIVFAFVVFAFAWRNGYLSSRHFGLPVVTLLPDSAVGLVGLGGALGGRVRRLAATHASEPNASAQCALKYVRRAKIATAVLAMVFVAGCLAASLRPAHHSQLAHRRAADWLRSAAAAPGAVLDQQGWTALYTGRKTYRFDAAETALADPRLAYVVVERRDWEAESPRGRSLRAVLGEAEGAVAVFAADRGRRERDVLIFPKSSIDVAQGGRRDAR